MARLPLEMINEIICRLSVKDLLRYRSVCKEWCSLIDGPDFIRTLLGYWRSDAAVWDPSTRKYTKLSFNNTDSPYPSAVIGFGYDPVIDDHKLLTSTIISRGKDMSEFQLYRVKAKTWERLTEDFSDNFGYDDFGRHALVSTSLACDAKAAGSRTWLKYPIRFRVRSRDLQSEQVFVAEFRKRTCPLHTGGRIRRLPLLALPLRRTRTSQVARSDGPGYFVYGVPLKYYETTVQLLLYVDCERLILYDLKTKTTKDVKIPGIPESIGALLGVRSLVGI
ncbi:F-box domain containing protein [Trema orientale]|uniref:F-box domain containing protein n=1 Tax=Trema orientale TaxID=63057 RepID=A0A2P5FXQ3_TREOI|nr:F-box domain containing protein [Trema orientale]